MRAKYLRSWKNNLDFKEQYAIEFTEDCRDEIKKIFEYISENLAAEKAAMELMRKMRNNIINLSRFPKICVRISKTDKSEREYRRMIINNYIVLYTIDEDKKKIYISHMYYSGKNYINGGII